MYIQMRKEEKKKLSETTYHASINSYSNGHEYKHHAYPHYEEANG
jgi:hypothetical protein